ncbi:DNA mismatch repair protein MutL [Desulforamulus reducens MI-1]|uniref:DNA mismatch repair protein MutL n=1 Tax=Desulforamulus reducens (strain ATCC BAA-1160 / DSM 100696 / MI-1) TaxID=349161 RepID=MUTL_DESRM|nr:DNA mismatch repair endonuclease MutL [Desulforamulus reducens]A4J5Q3.1 RecName: Full=DNA mismatch repair protein MutL [Desulforamulus reducens MI-1]ABO50406.1 DNA mismatch repair protein MutL [Desulforamulus reducens MI-1]
MSNITILDEATANKIAAGEVVERPVSVVKELVENSLDAGANRISVELTQGGITGIKVVDNGYGMPAEDVQLCFLRHATSKIKRAEDLNSILTLGFRGEALPSIAAVSKVTLTTRTEDELAGTTMQIEGGYMQNVVPTGCPVGTIIEIKDLFFNTPARRKFLKTANAETSQVSDLITRLAMARPDVRFELRSGNRVLFSSPGTGSLKDTAAVIFGLDNVRSMLEIGYQGKLLSVAGLISKPVLTRASRHYQNFFINGRYIRSGFLSSILQQAYDTLIPAGRFPIAILHIDIDPTQVDVNVHPTKMEIRMAREGEIQEELLAALSDSLNVPTAITGLWEIMPGRTKNTATDQRAENLEVKPDSKEKELQPKESQHPRLVACDLPSGKIMPPRHDQEQLHFSSRRIAPVRGKNSLLPDEGSSINREEIPPVVDVKEQQLKENPNTYQPAETLGFPVLVPAGQVPPTYVLAHGEGGLYIIDQHAAHERVLYEKYLYLLGNYVEAQMLLEPLTLEIPHHEAQLIIKHIVDFNELGFILEHFGGDTFLLRGVPTNAITEPKEVFLDLLARLQENPSQKVEKNLVLDHLAAAMACRDAVKSGQHFSAVETKALLDGLARCQKPYTCPHGRPTLIQISQEELKKRFKR